MRCCICGQQIAEREPAVLFVGNKGDEQVVCEACEKKFELLYNSTDKQRKLTICKFFKERAERCQDPEVREHLKELLREGGYDEKEPTGTGVSLPPPAEESGWGTLLRLLVWLEILGGCIGSVAMGTGLGTAFDAPALGVGISIVGILMSFILSAAVMVFLDMASDIRSIRNQMKK